eukprot:3359948-Rhodomonas_salina.3
MLQLTITALFIGVYASTLYPTVPGGDSGELIVAACTLGIPHPPGYPLHTLLGHLFLRVFPGTPAARVNFLSAVCSAVTSGILYSTVEMLSAAMLRGADSKTVTMASKVGAFVGAGMYGFSPLVWMYSTQAEVFALNNLFASLLAFQTCRILLAPRASCSL